MWCRIRTVSYTHLDVYKRQPKAYMRNHQSLIQSFKYNEDLLKGYTNIIIAPGPHAHSLTLYALSLIHI